MAKALWVCAMNNDTLATGATGYNAIFGRAQQTGTETIRYTTINTAGIFSNLYVLVRSNTTSGSSTVRFRVNQANGNQVVTIGAGATGEFTDASNTDTITGGEKVNTSETNGGGGTLAISLISVLYAATSNTISLLGFSGNAASYNLASTTQYTTMGGFSGDNGQATEAFAQMKVNSAGTLKNLFIIIQGNARVTDVTFITRINGSDGTITKTIGAGATGIFEDTTHTDSVSSGDKINFKWTSSTGTQNLDIAQIFISFETTNNTFILSNGKTSAAGTAVTNGATLYMPSGGSTADATEGDGSTTFMYRANVQVACTATRLWCYVGANTSIGNSTLVSRINGSDGALTVGTIGTLATGEFEDTTHSDVLVATDEIDWKMNNAGAAGTITFREVSMLMTVSGGATPTPGNSNQFFMLLGLGT